MALTEVTGVAGIEVECEIKLSSRTIGFESIRPIMLSVD